MPLDKSCSLDAMSKNISQSVDDGKPQKQAVAISYSVLAKACGVEGEKMTPKEMVAAGGTKEGMTDVRFGMTETTPASFMKGLKGTPTYKLGTVKGVEPKESVKAIVDELPKVLKDFPYLSMLKTVGVDIEAENKDEVLVTLNYDGKDVAAEFESYPGVENEQGAHRAIHSSIHKDLKAKLGGSKFTTTNEDDTVDATSSRGAWIMLHVKPSDFGLKVESVTKRVRVAFGAEPLAEKTKQEPTPMVCNECGAKFKKVIGAKTYEVKCPKCGSYDTEPA